jgi:DNA topoisomerase-1
MSEESVTLETALKLLALPRELGQHPESGEPVLASQGRFGPYVRHGDEYRSLEESDDLLAIELPRALELLAAPKRSRRRQAAARTVLRDLGAHPRSGAPIRLLAGRYGPYVTDGSTNASLPRGTDPSAISSDEAASLIDARAAAGPRPRAGRRTARKSTTRRRATAAEA